MSRLPLIGLAGAGRAARALAAGLARCPEGARGLVWSRTRASREQVAALTGFEAVSGPGELVARADWVLLAVRDDAVDELAAVLAGSLDRAGDSAACRVALHLAGSRTRDALSPLASRNVACGVFHPVVALAGEQAAARLEGATATVSGDPEARAAARRLAEALGMLPLEVDDAARPLVHLACVMAAGDVVTLLGLAEELLGRADIPAAEARRLVFTLARSALAGYQALGPTEGLTGPIARADAETLARHREALEDGAPVTDGAGAVHLPLADAALRALVAAGRLSPGVAERLARAAGLPGIPAAGTTRGGPASPAKPDRPRRDDR